MTPTKLTREQRRMLQELGETLHTRIVPRNGILRSLTK